MATITYREALNQALSEEIDRDDQVVLMGEEVAQFKGSYKVSEGMLEKFGSDRIIDTPISEAAFSGLAVGAAIGYSRLGVILSHIQRHITSCHLHGRNFQHQSLVGWVGTPEDACALSFSCRLLQLL